mgnify:CR=1 FL=1
MKKSIITLALLALTAGLVSAQENKSWKRLENNVLLRGGLFLESGSHSDGNNPGAATAYQQTQRKAEVQVEAYTLNLKKLEQGLISPLEFQTANNNYLKAQADEMNSLFKYLIKQAVV